MPPGSRAGVCAIAVMAKAPQPGRSKTRLVPPLTPEQAAALSAAFLRDMTENIALAARRQPIHGSIAYAPAGLEALFAGHLARGTGLVLADGNLDLPSGVRGFGKCLLHAIQTLLAQGYGSACVLNSDSPTLPTGFLERAAAALGEPGERVVLGAAEDGGYYLLGLKSPDAHMFADIDWSTERVAAQTRARARARGLPVVELGTWYDVDDRVSLNRLMAELDDGTSDVAYRAPATSAVIERLGLRRVLGLAA
jgi:rSAM/selenodomain-associated transferase 1